MQDGVYLQNFSGFRRQASQNGEEESHISGRGANETSRPAARFLSQCDMNHIISKLEDVIKYYEVDAMPTTLAKMLIHLHA